MFASVSGLGRLFGSVSTSSPNPTRAQRQLESITEETLTHDLLYPEGEILRQCQNHSYPFRHGDPSSVAAAASSSDDRGALDIQASRDVRIVIAQDMHGNPRFLYDSHPPLPLTSIRASPNNSTDNSGLMKENTFETRNRRSGSLQKSHTAPHSRQSSFSQAAHSIFMSPTSPLSPVNEFGGMFGSSKPRSGNTRPGTSDGESAQSKLAREDREETEDLLGQMFGGTGMTHVSSTKVHIKPSTPSISTLSRPPSSGATLPLSPRGAPKRRTPLTRSTTTEDLQSLAPSPVHESTAQQTSRVRSSAVAITKIFSVDPGDPDFSQTAKEDQNIPVPERGSQSSELSDRVRMLKLGDGQKSKQIKTPTFAVALVLYLPSNRTDIGTSSARASPAPGTSTFVESFPDIPGLEGANIGNVTDPRIDYIIAQWSVLVRALSSLEIIARCKLSDSLAQHYLSSVAPSPVGHTSTGSGLEDRKPRQPARLALQLATGALQQDQLISKAADMTSKRVARALQIRHVVTGQSRWGIWRENARGVGKWSGGQEQNYFLFNFLTAFLGSHTEWLDYLGPGRYRRRHREEKHKSRLAINTVRHRTVIVSLDKMAARRLIFLLAAFLPPNYVDGSHDRPREASPGLGNPAYASSPPFGGSISRRQSLRRTANLHARGSLRGRRSRSQERPYTEQDSDDATKIGDELSKNHFLQPRSRRPSDAGSIRSVAMPIAGNSSATRKSSTTTTATVIPGEPVVGVPHFSPYTSELAFGTSAEPRPGSSGSFAALSLQRTLSRTESNEHNNASTGSQANGRRGSTRSGFWGSRRGSSTENSDLLASSEEGLGISGMPKERHARPSINQLTQMVEDADRLKAHNASQSGGTSPLTARNIPLASSINDSSPPKISPSRLSPELLKYSVDETDGVIDIDFPFPSSQASSYTSTQSSPPAINTAASSLNNPSFLQNQPPNLGPSLASPPKPDLNAAGWLRTYHQDFILQAVRPYDSLKEDIKISMRTEPASSPLDNHRTPTTTTPTIHQGPSDWTTICTTLIADTTNFTLTLVTLRRRDPTSPHHQADALLGIPSSPSPSTHKSSPSTNPDEEIISETLSSNMADITLKEAVERVLSSSHHNSGTSSRAPSPPRSNPHPHQHGKKPEGGNRESSQVPRNIECRKLVLGALEGIARSVGAEMSAAAGNAAHNAAANSNAPANANASKKDDDTTIPTDSLLREGVRRWIGEVGGIGMGDVKRNGSVAVGA